MPEPMRMPAQEPWLLDEAEGVALAYHLAARGDAWAALVAMARDALADQDALKAQVSRGYVRGTAEA